MKVYICLTIKTIPSWYHIYEERDKKKGRVIGVNKNEEKILQSISRNIPFSRIYMEEIYKKHHFDSYGVTCR